jgi:hypothetical protein
MRTAEHAVSSHGHTAGPDLLDALRAALHDENENEALGSRPSRAAFVYPVGGVRSARLPTERNAR